VTRLANIEEREFLLLLQVRCAIEEAEDTAAGRRNESEGCAAKDEATNRRLAKNNQERLTVISMSLNVVSVEDEV
jgi:hypothetical protein